MDDKGRVNVDFFALKVRVSLSAFAQALNAFGRNHFPLLPNTPAAKLNLSWMNENPIVSVWPPRTGGTAHAHCDVCINPRHLRNLDRTQDRPDIQLNSRAGLSVQTEARNRSDVSFILHCSFLLAHCSVLLEKPKRRCGNGLVGGGLSAVRFRKPPQMMTAR